MDTGEGILFPSRRDRWLTLLIWLGSSGCVFGAIAAFGSGEGLLFTMLFPVIMIVSAVFMLWVLYGTGYRMSEQGLNIRSGPFRMNLAIERIVSVTPSRNPLSSPACSLDRLMIEYAGGARRIMVSPQDKPRFLETLRERNSRLRYTDDGCGLQDSGGE